MIIWGTKVTKRELGRIAEFCLLCRTFRPFRLIQTETVGHLYYVPLGRRRAQGRTRTCEVCRTAYDHGLPRGADGPYPRDGEQDLEALLEATNPNARANWAERLRLEERIKAGSLAPAERAELVLEPFRLLGPVAAAHSGKLNFGGVVWVGGLAAIAVPVAVLSFGHLVWKQASSETMQWFALVLAGSLGALTVAAYLTDGRRYARRRVLPVLARALAPLRPSEDEIARALGALKQSGARIGDVLRVDEIMDAVRARELEFPD